MTVDLARPISIDETPLKLVIHIHGSEVSVTKQEGNYKRISAAQSSSSLILNLQTSDTINPF